MSYQGYKNYETWALSLWLDNDCSRYNHWNSLAQDYVTDYGYEPKYPGTYSFAAMALADNIKENIEDSVPELGNGIYSDLLNAAMSEIDYRELAKGYCDATTQGVKALELSSTGL